MDSHAWDDRYAAADLVWSAGPNATIAELTADLPPGIALDLASGEGRNAIWLAERGWEVTAVDFSQVATERAERLATQRLAATDVKHRGRLTAVAADVLTWEPSATAPEVATADGQPGREGDRTAYDLVLVVFFHVAAPARAALHRRAARWLAPGGRLVVLAHDRSNLTEGVGGPQDPAVLPTPAEVVADLAGQPGLRVERAEVILRPVATADGERTARDCLVIIRTSPRLA